MHKSVEQINKQTNETKSKKKKHFFSVYIRNQPIEISVCFTMSFRTCECVYVLHMCMQAHNERQPFTII